MPPAPDPAPPRIVFFGPPNVGKTTLITAFLRAAHAGDEVPLTPAGAGPRDVVPYAFPAAPIPDPGSPAGCVLIDTDGETAAKLMAHPDRFHPRAVRSEPTSVTAAVYAADALVVLIPASADDEEVDRLFRDFGRFLDRLEGARTAGREVGGLPVFLTLTKCDTIWQSGDEPAAWQARVEAREEVVRTRFEEYLAGEQHDTGPLGFGSLDVAVAATAVRYPDAPEFAALGGEPFGVDALMRECTAAARAYRSRVVRAGQRLRWTVAGAAGVVVALAGGLAALLASPPPGDPLADRVRAFRDRLGPPAVRLADKNFAKNEGELTAIRESPGFDRLPEDLRTFVESELREFAAYKDYRDRFRPPQLGPNDVRSRAELDGLRADLAGPLAPPPGFAWAGTEAERLWEKWKTDARLLGTAEETLYEWYRGLVRRATALELVPAVDYRWRGDVAALVADAGTPPFRPDDPIPGSPKVPARRGAPLTYGPAFEFDRMALARQDWENEKARLLDLRGLADALGMTVGPGAPPAVLDLPEPTGNPAESRVLPGARLRALRETYPSRSGDYADWVVTRFPDPVRRDLRERLGRAFDAGARHARGLILDRLGTVPETPAGWQPVAGWLGSDPAMKDWGQLLGLLRRLAGAGPGDPVSELAAFLRLTHFDAVVRVVELTVPDDLRGQRAVATGPFVIRVTPSGGQPQEYRYRPDGGPRRDGPASVTRFVPDGHDGKMTIHPGDDVTADVPLRAGGQEFRLAWDGGRPGVYTFDRLAHQPEVRRADGSGPGERATGVRLVLLPEGGWPTVPVLLP